MITTGKINVAGAFHSVADDGIVAYTGDVYDAGLKMSQYEINRLEGGITGDYAWKVVTSELYYASSSHNSKTLYFITDGTVEDSTSTISGNALLLAGTLSGNIITTYGTVSNNNLTLI